QIVFVALQTRVPASLPFLLAEAPREKRCAFQEKGGNPTFSFRFFEQRTRRGASPVRPRDGYRQECRTPDHPPRQLRPVFVPPEKRRRGERRAVAALAAGKTAPGLSGSGKV